MPYREKPASDATIYHIFNRGVEKRTIFENDYDRRRFIQSLYYFNDSSPAENMGRNVKEVKLPSEDGREKIVEILAYCLMPNHYHLVVQGIQEDGVSEFMRKIGTGYTNYFNLRYKRVGSLFQGSYKAIAIIHEKHLHYLLYYIHLNPLMETESEGSLTSFKWSSYGDYVGKSDFPRIVSTDFFTEILGGRQEIEKQAKFFATQKRQLLKEKLEGLELEV